MFGIDDLIDSIKMFFYELVLMVDLLFCKILSFLYQMFEVFAGIKTVKYNGKFKYLTNVFFEDTTIGTIYKAMAMVGITLCFGFTIYAVIKKMFDIDDKIKNSLGGIIGSMLKSILFIILLQVIVSFALRATNVLMQRVVYIFNNAENGYIDDTIEFDSADYATMARVLNTIGNYSLNPSRDSRYNINSCYNSIRNELQTLSSDDVFKYTYEEYPDTWQYCLTQIANAHDLGEDQDLDIYNESLSDAIKNCMDELSLNGNFSALQSYTSSVKPIDSDSTPFDVIIFMAGTTDAAWNSQYNEDPSIYDTLRYPYMKSGDGSKSIYDIDQVEADFDISFSAFGHLVIIILGVMLSKTFLALCVNCIARIFNMALLYVIAPPFIAMSPMDDGEKTKQWSTAFTVQAFSVFGSVIGIRVLLVFVPIIFSSKLVLFEDNVLLDFLARIIMIFSVTFTINEAAKIVTGILANNAGFQSIQAADVGNTGAARLMAGAKKIAGHMPGVGAAKNAIQSKFENSTMGKLMGYGDWSKQGFDSSAKEAKREKQDQAKHKKELTDGLNSKDPDMKADAQKKLSELGPMAAKKDMGMSASELRDLKHKNGIEDKPAPAGNNLNQNSMAVMRKNLPPNAK